MTILWRIALSLFGAGGLGVLAFVASLVSQNPPASMAVMIFGILVFVGVAIMSLGAMVFGLYKPIRDWLEARAAPH